MLNTQILSVDHTDVIQIALEILDAGGLVAFPTDTVYGLACNPFNETAIEKIYDAKTRDAAKAIAVLVGETNQLDQLTPGFTLSAQKLAHRFWPGALTLVVPKAAHLPANLSAYPTLGVRMPDHTFALSLLRASGPLATTSANLSGGVNTRTAQEVAQQLSGRVHLIIDGGSCPGGVPSTVVDCTVQPPSVLRAGAISADQIEACLSE